MAYARASEPDSVSSAGDKPLASAPGAADRVCVSTGGRDPDWDEFVHSAPGGHHVQTSLWADVKAQVGWRGTRVILRRDGVIVGGCQLLYRQAGRFATVAFAPRAPLARAREPAMLASVVAGMHQAARDAGVLYLKLSPPAGGEDLEPTLEALGFVKSGLAAGPSATVRLDLAREPDQLLAGMRASTRSNIRKAARKGVEVRIGRREDLATFSALVEETARRQGFSAYPAGYYERMWTLFGEDDRACLLMAEVAGRVVAAILLIGYGDTATYKMGAWSGERSSVHPNEVLHWTAIEWAQARGYRFYDLEGIPVGVATALLDGDAPEQAGEGTTRFKLGFGGEVILLPRTYDYAYGRLAGAVLRAVAPRLDRWRPLAGRLLGRQPT